MKSHLNGKDLFLVGNTWTVSIIRPSATFLDCTKEETKERDHWTVNRRQSIAPHVKCYENLYQTEVWRSGTDQYGRVVCSRIMKYRSLSC